MKKPLILFILLTAALAVRAQVIRPMTARYSNPSVKGNIVYVSNNIITSAGTLTTEAPPGGTAVNNSHVSENIDIESSGSSNTSFIALGATWKYYSTGAAPGGSWKNLGYNDVAWPAGASELGYGDGDEATCIPSGGGGTLCAPTGNKYITSYFRKSVTIPNPALFGAFIFNVERDDGVVVYVNGVEVKRDNLPTGVIAYGTLATAAVEDAVVTFTVPTSYFVSGTNDIAVEVHQNGATSSDLSFNLSLEGTTNSYLYIAMGDTWKYWANTQANAPAATWKNVGFNDAAWTTAATEMGYGDGDETTCIPSGGGGTVCAPTGNKYITTYFRKVVNIPSPSSFGTFTFNVERDDGFVLYVNGTEITRNNMPNGAIAYATLATAAVDDEVITVSVSSAVFSAGNNTIAVEVHQNAINSSDLSFNLSLEAFTDRFVGSSAQWKYLDNNTRPANWETTAYNDAAWASGFAYLGYGDTHIRTTVSYGPDVNNKYVTTYFRKVVNIPNASSYAQFILKLRRDDGAVVYVNGTEAVRSNMPAGVIAHGTLAAGNVSGAAETADNTYILSSSLFVNGNNTIAVEVHQDQLNSSDLGFDLQLDGSNDSTFNSSSADLTLPSCTQVLFAGLYWGATQGTDGTNTAWITNENSVDLKLPGSSSYITLTSSQTDYHNGTLVPGLPHTGYRCFVDITSLLNATSPNGTYTIANVCSPAGIVNAAGGWTIVIAYSDPSTITRNLTVFDGSVIMNGGDPALNIPISGFNTPPSGPVSCELGAVVYDGDRVSTDEFSFKQDSNPAIGSYTNLTPNATANLNDMWNSTISYKGSVVTTRVPAHQNTLGYDADIIDVPNAGNAVLGNSQSSASIRFSSPSENYMLQVATTAISQYSPIFDFRKNSTDVNGGSLAPGDVIRYQLSYQNTGNDASVSTNIVDRIPRNTTYRPGTISINGVAKTDAAGDDEAEYDIVNDQVVFRLGTGASSSSGGEIAPAASGQVRFEVITARSCLVFSCAPTVVNRARIGYGGKISGINLADSSGVMLSGCNTPNPVNDILTGSCTNPADTLLVNICPATSVTIPVALYGGYRFFSGIPFNSGNVYNPATPVTFTRLIYAFYDGPGSCDDTIRINCFITSCPDIDDDNDGLPDYLELNNPVALQDHDSDGIPNWNDVNYPGYIDLNTDGFNDNFDPSADSDNDGIPNFADANFPGYSDSNGDGINDNMDKDRDGIPNHLDLDSDNDGLPDTVESFGVDANGDGRIDNYTDTDNDGFSQNVDANNTGVAGSSTGLGALDTDSDGIPNYLDLDSDNDGIPDIIEAFGTDAANSAKVSAFADFDGDGYTDALDADVDNDNIAENSGGPLLKTGPDMNSDGRADSWPNKNMEGDSKPNPYDLDSDNDGITDVKEAQLTDANWDGRVDGAVDVNGRNSALAALPALTIPNTDGVGRSNPYDIDSDDDGIPDNVEGMTTIGYLLPGTTDTDSDGLINTYDNFNGFGGDGIHPVDKDGDTIPDYLDSDTDGDGLIDRIEGNDFNFNATPDDLVTLTGVDTDGDGLDNRFDANNSSIEGTSAYMGNGGTTSGDVTPGSTTVVQHTWIADGFGCTTERDWRCVFYVLHCEIINFKAALRNQQVNLDWTVLCRQEVDHFIIQRSTDRLNYTDIATVTGRRQINETESYSTVDNNVASLGVSTIFYRLVTVGTNGKSKISNVIMVRVNNATGNDLLVTPNPVRDQLQLIITAAESAVANISVIDMSGRLLMQTKERVGAGNTTVLYPQAAQFPPGVYYVRLNIGETVITRRFNVIK
ncbi:MAG: T9SS type A sorting domain-containing protein [Chitinophagaceae bacterium]|nr:T9SS type A sorting domain-containing protein [Chitinophagaceae bacterium]